MCIGADLYVYDGAWGLPSIDFECLRVLCLVKFTRCPLKVNTNGNPLRSGAGKLPYLQVGNKKFVGYRVIKDFLDKENFPIDTHLSGKSRQLSPAYANWVFTNLHGYYSYFMYGDPNNYEITRTFYAKRTPFPFNFYYPVTYQKEATDIVLTMGGFDVHDKLDRHGGDFLTLNAKKCVNILSKKLGKKVWFFGDVFSEFDAIVYSYLAILYKIPLPNNPLQSHIKGCQNLVNFINRISKDVFKSETLSSVKRIKGSTYQQHSQLTPTERHFLESEKTTKIFAAIGAVIAMCTFALWRGFHRQITTSRYYDTIDGDDLDDEDDDGMD